MSHQHITLSHRDCRGNLDISQDGLSARYRGSIGFPDEHQMNVGSVKGNAPFPRSGTSYFELTVVNPGNTGVIGIGLMTEESRLSNMVGWGKHDWGCHADDGAVVVEGKGHHGAPSCTYSASDTVGCGITWGHSGGVIFFTKNGKFLGTPIHGIDQQVWPAVSIRSTAGEARANFGQSHFVFDIQNYVQNPKAVQKQGGPFHKHSHEFWNHIVEGMSEGAAEAAVGAIIN